MNKFVNFAKRSVALPSGCKDLIDVLQRAKRDPASTMTTHSAEGLGDVATHLSRLLEAGAKSRYLAITWYEMNYVQVISERGALTVLAVVHEITQREQAVRDVFKAASLKPIHDEA